MNQLSRRQWNQKMAMRTIKELNDARYWLESAAEYLADCQEHSVTAALVRTALRTLVDAEREFFRDVDRLGYEDMGEEARNIREEITPKG